MGLDLDLRSVIRDICLLFASDIIPSDELDLAVRRYRYAASNARDARPWSETRDWVFPSQRRALIFVGLGGFGVVGHSAVQVGDRGDWCSDIGSWSVTVVPR